MTTGSLARGRVRIAVEFAPALADAINAEVGKRSERYGGASASDIIREAVAAFLLPIEASNSSHNGNNSSTTVKG